ncbi:hypothetical protein QUF75_06220 [Desulfococcaceae bacterium HSG7]|nr:hypothetical protein [Desulfococcaceae bacterium HSG7]
MESLGAQKLSAAIFSIRHHPETYRFRGLQKTAALNFCAPCHIFRHFPSIENVLELIVIVEDGIGFWGDLDIIPL